MILTCPSCGTRYVVKDGAIPAAGRTVRCAQCKHSWHQDPDDTPADEGSAEAGGQYGDEAGQPLGEESSTFAASERGDAAYPAQVSDGETDPHAETPQSATPAAMLAEPETAASMPEEAGSASEPYPEAAVPIDGAPVTEPETNADDQRSSHPLRAARMETEDLYSPFAASDEEEAPRRRWPLLIGALLLVVAVVAAGIFFLAPAELKGRLGLAQGAAVEDLTIQVQQHGRTQLASGNQLYEVSGLVRNETDQVLPVPPMNAQLRSLNQKVVYSWTIPISPQRLPPGASATFNSANLDIPADAACLEVFFGQQRDIEPCRAIQSAGA